MPSTKSQPKTAAQRNMPSIGEHLESVYAYSQYAGKLKNGQLYVLYNGNWISDESFNLVVPKPKVIENFRANLRNFDTTGNWLNS